MYCVFVLMTCFSYRVAAKFSDVISVNTFVLFLFWKHISPTFLTSTWPRAEPAAFQLSPWLMSCTVSVPWSGPRTHTDTPLCAVLSSLPSSQWGLSSSKKRKNFVIKERVSCSCRRRLSSTEIRVIKRNAAGAVWHNTPPYLPTYLPTHPPQERFSVSAGATQSGRDSKYSTV